jgi:methyl-accepting chemotaxis protein
MISKELDHNVTSSHEALEATAKVVETGELGHKNMLASLEMIKELTQEMIEVKKSMRQINDITFQTELLSLNAAVEAARSKEEGRGFSVVAQEVRRLAQTCAQTASKTEEVTERVFALVEHGNIAMEQTASYFQQLLDGVLAIKKTAEDIASNSNKHSQMITELHKAILEIEHGANTVEKQSISLQTSVQSLSQQSDQLESILKDFEFREQEVNISTIEQLELDPKMARSILRWIQQNQHRIISEEKS